MTAINVVNMYFDIWGSLKDRDAPQELAKSRQSKSQICLSMGKIVFGIIERLNNFEENVHV